MSGDWSRAWVSDDGDLVDRLLAYEDSDLEPWQRGDVLEAADHIKTLRDALTALVEEPPSKWDQQGIFTECGYCEEDLPRHADDCPWVAARALLDPPKPEPEAAEHGGPRCTRCGRTTPPQPLNQYGFCADCLNPQRGPT